MPKKAAANNPRYAMRMSFCVMKECPYCQGNGEFIDGYLRHFTCALTGRQGVDICDYEEDWMHCSLNDRAVSQNYYRYAKKHERVYWEKVVSNEEVK